MLVLSVIGLVGTIGTVKKSAPVCLAAPRRLDWEL
jgi:hypothetical protein